jgi:hypothetical protein
MVSISTATGELQSYARDALRAGLSPLNFHTLLTQILRASCFVVSLLELGIEATPLPRCVAFPSLLFFLSPPLFGALLHIALHLNPLLLWFCSLLLLVVFHQLSEELRYAEEVEEHEVETQDACYEEED